MNERVMRVVDSWMPFIVLMALFVATIVSLAVTGVIAPALQGILAGLVLIQALMFIPNKKSKFIMDKDK